MRAFDILSGRLGAAWEREQRDTLFLMLAIAFTLLPHAWHLPVWVSGLTMTLLAYRVWLTVQGQPLPSRWLLLPLALAACVALFLHFRTLLGRDAGVAFLVVLVALKLLEMHARRDVFVVLGMGCFLILTNFLYSESIPTAAMMLLALLAIVLAQINLQFGHSEPAFRGKVKMAGLLLLQALPLMLVLFVLFPRISSPLWGLPKDAFSGKTGLSDTMEPGSVSNLASSGEIAFRVQFDAALPPAAQLYWRGPVLDEFDGRRWKKSVTAAHDSAPLQLRIDPGAAPVEYTVTLEAHNKPWVFVLEAPLALPVIERYSVRASTDMQLLSEQPITERVRYRARSQPRFALTGGGLHWQLQLATRLPPDANPRTRAWAAQLRAQEQDPARLLEQVLDHFRSQPFRYTLNPPLLGQHTADEFLFDTQAGFCEHYAGSFVIAMRALGIPARVVTGYQGGEVNPVDGFLAVRQADAHAWAEVWLEHGWVRVDPTALVSPDRIEAGIASSLPDNAALPLLVRTDIDWLKRVRFNWQAINNGWNQWVLSFNSERQRALLERLGFSAPDWRTLSLLLALAVGLILAVLAATLWLRHRQTDPLSRLYSRYCAIVAAQGVQRQDHEAAIAFARRALRQLEREQSLDRRQAELIRQGAQLYADLRYRLLDKTVYQKKFLRFKTCVKALSDS